MGSGCLVVGSHWSTVRYAICRQPCIQCARTGPLPRRGSNKTGLQQEVEFLFRRKGFEAMQKRMVYRWRSDGELVGLIRLLSSLVERLAVQI